jgi:hypothetical protein
MATIGGTRISGSNRSTPPDHQLPPGRGADRGLGLSQLLRELIADTRTLVRQEIELAKVETTRTAKRLAVDGVWIAAGAAVVALGGLCLVLAMALGLGALLGSYWLGTLITGLVLVLIGALAAWKGVGDLKRGNLAPEQTVDSVKEDAAWARRELEEFKQELKGS